MLLRTINRSAPQSIATINRSASTRQSAAIAPTLARKPAIVCKTVNRSAAPALSTVNLQWGNIPVPAKQTQDMAETVSPKLSFRDPQLPQKLSAKALAAEADIIETHGLEYWLSKGTGEYDAEFSKLATELFGEEPEQLAARQRSNSKRLRRHNVLDHVAYREELATRDPQALLDRDLHPLQSPVSRPLQAMPHPINHLTLCSGETESIFREEMGLPSIADDWHNPMTVAQREYDDSHRQQIVASGPQSPVRQFLASGRQPYACKGDKRHVAARKVRAKHLRKYRDAILRHLHPAPIVPDAVKQRLLTFQLAAARGVVQHAEVCQLAVAAGIPAPRVAFSRN